MKKPTITTIASGYYSRQALNTNFENLRDSFDNTLSLDGSTPNSMGADLDMNGNDILNAGTMAVADLTVAGLDVNTALNSAVSASAASAVASDVSAVASEASAQESAASASSAALYDGPWIDDVATLLADTTLTLPPGQPNTVVIGDYVRTRKEGFSYEVVASGGDVVTAGGIELDVLVGSDGMHNVRAFGAKGDASTDDTAAVQKAINASWLGGIVFFPKGEYVVSTLTRSGPNWSMVGTNAGNKSNQTSGSMHASVIRFTEPTADAFTFTYGGFFSKNISIENMGFQANTAGAVISFDSYAELTFKNCFINNKGTGDGVSLVASYLISFTDCFITKTANLRNATAVGVRLANAQLGGIFNFITSTINQYGTGVKYDSLYTDTSYIENFNFIGSQANSNTHGLELYGNIRSGTISGSYFEGQSGASIWLAQGASNFLISGCFFNDPASTQAPVRFGRTVFANDDFVRNITVANCYFSSINFYGVWSKADPAFGGNILITGCSFDKLPASVNTTEGIRLQTYNYAVSVQDCTFETIDVEISGTQRLKRAVSAGTTQGSYIQEDLSGTAALTADFPRIVTYNPLGANRTARLPLIADAVGKEFLISNKVGSGFNLLVKDSTNVTTYQTLTPGQSTLCWNDGVSQFTYVL